YRVTFKYTNKDEYAYANPDGTVTVPAAGAGYTWAYNEEEFTSGTPVTADMTVTAVKKSLTAEIQGDIVTSNGTGIYKDDIASGFAALITSNLKTSISKIAVTAYEHDYTTENLPELTIDSGSGIVIGIIIPGITITSASDITFNIE
ncbi:MAG: hypothetical protein J1G06_06905, partial [Oscillospiraceae bacterium]|nr:hypothetical protein [Oscillospiraceae bacterium]